MRIKRVTLDKIASKKLLKNLDVDSGGISILNKKLKCETFLIESLHVGAANILKQEAISVGADLAVPKGTIIASDKYVDTLLIANQRSIEKLIPKLKLQPFGLKELAEILKNHIKSKNNYKTKIMGIININSDSFYRKSRTNITNAINSIEKAIEDGADIVDIGAVSSRPNSIEVSEDEELSRVKTIFDEIYKNSLYERVELSIDTYSPLVANYALKSGFKIVNNIKGIDEDIAKIISSYDAKTVIMHMQGSPKDMQNSPEYSDVILDIEKFFEDRLEIAYKYSINDVILDVGIGFGKTLEHNLLLIQNLSHFQKFNKELLIGASRKSMIDMITPSKIEDRLAGTLAIHLKSIENGASIIRCHDIKEHIQAIKVNEAIREIF